MQLKKEINRLKRDILSLSAVVEENVRKAVVSVGRRDAALALEVITSDKEIDEMEVELEEECLKILALHQPVAADLRFIVAVLKINNDLERIGDLAVNIAKRSRALAKGPVVDAPVTLGEMMEKARSMLHRSLDALVDTDPAMAKEVLVLDDDVDEMHKSIYEEVRGKIEARPETAGQLIQFLTVSRNLERIGDQATNIAEDVIYLTEGKIIRHRADEAQ